jgi:adiponectin receptor
MAVPKKLLKWSELPSWQQDNHYILSHYRPATNSFYGCFQSMFYLHNETVNVYTHLLGSFVFTLVGILLYDVLRSRYSSASLGDVLAFSCFFGGAALCLGMSGFYHLITNHSPEVSSFGNKLDYLGIVFLIAGSYAPMVYYGFSCHPELQVRYWTMVCKLF